ncbi:alternative oxidase-domain-containing protein [Entophlyctis helioformis]|nr:alternative oxidase-domain-containing protein [Entophlyctis helioformis]
MLRSTLLLRPASATLRSAFASHAARPLAIAPSMSRLPALSSSSSPYSTSAPSPSSATSANEGSVNVDESALGEYSPRPVRPEFASDKPLDTKALELIDVGVGVHRLPVSPSDYAAIGTVKFLRFFSDVFFRRRYVHRAVVLETVAAVPGMVAGMLRHLTSLRRMRHDGGWISHLLHEAENERMHLMTWMKVCTPTVFERALILVTQGAFFNIYFAAYLFFPKTAHRMVGYLEEEAVVSYTHFLNEIDAGRIENGPAPEIAKTYWHLADDATLRDVVLAVRADESNHRDINHHFADRMVVGEEDLRRPVSPDTLRLCSSTRESTSPSTNLIISSCLVSSRLVSRPLLALDHSFASLLHPMAPMNNVFNSSV